MILFSLGIVILCIAVYGIIQKYNTVFVLFLAGLVLWSLALIFDANFYTVEGFTTTGSKIIDVFAIFSALLSTNVGGIGLIIMSAGGFSKYMDSIGAADTFVMLGSKPLSAISSPYVLVGITVIFTQIVSIFIPSASGLSMLLVVTLYPLLRKLKVSAASAAAALASAACLELGPASGTSSLAAELSGTTPTQYFVDYQSLSATVSIITMAVLFALTAKYFDRKEGLKAKSTAENIKVKENNDTGKIEKELRKKPLGYALLPIFPLFLLLGFSDYVISSVHIDVVSAMVVSFVIAVFFELYYSRNLRESMKGTAVFFSGMADMLRDVVFLLVAAQFFATGLEAVGFAHYLLHNANNLGFGVMLMTIVLIGIIGALTIISGSGNAGFLSFSNLAPEVAEKMGVPAIQMLLPMQTAAGTFRAMSPVAGVVIAVAGATGVDPITIVKRTAIPMLGAISATFIMAQFF